jgi:hypothetical protein
LSVVPVHHRDDVPTIIQVKPFFRVPVHHLTFRNPPALGVIPVLQNHHVVAGYLREPVRPIPFTGPVGVLREASFLWFVNHSRYINDDDFVFVSR